MEITLERRLNPPTPGYRVGARDGQVRLVMTADGGTSIIATLPVNQARALATGLYLGADNAVIQQRQGDARK